MQHTQTYDGSADPGEGGPTGAGSRRLVGSERVLAVLREQFARHRDGAVLTEELTRATGSPKPAVHRARPWPATADEIYEINDVRALDMQLDVNGVRRHLLGPR